MWQRIFAALRRKTFYGILRAEPTPARYRPFYQQTLKGVSLSPKTRLAPTYSFRFVPNLVEMSEADKDGEQEENNLPPGANATSDDKVDDSQLQSALRESYAAARRDKDLSRWVDYQESCYIYMYRGGGDPSEAIAAFDLDGTLIKPKSNKRIPRSATDWDIFSVWTKPKLQQSLRENNSRFIIFTNQNGVGLKIVPLEEVQRRIELVTKRINIPCTVFMATEKDKFRKPNLGMYSLLSKCFNDSLAIDRSKSFYCGDAVGYPSHSDADILFATRLELPFVPPDKFVRGVKPKLVMTDKDNKEGSAEDKALSQKKL